MEIQCRPMKVADFGKVECGHWESAQQVEEYIREQGIASMLAFSGTRFLGQLYLQEYDPGFRDPRGFYGERPWADFGSAQPLPVVGRFLTLGCYHVAEPYRGKGVGTALLESVIRWYASQQVFDGLLTWALQLGSRKLLVEAGQLPYTVYERYGFRIIKVVRDPAWTTGVTKETYPDATEKEPGLLRVMILGRQEENC